MWKHLIIVSILFAIRLSAYKFISIKPTLYSRLLRQSHVQLSAATLNEPKLSNSAAVKYSGSSGAAISINNVGISIGNNDILSNINWTILPNERWAIVGRNGEGKSTLLKAITQTGGVTLSIQEGEILIAKNSRIGFLEQKGVSGSTCTVKDEVTSRMDRLVAATENLKTVEEAVSNGDTSDDMLQKLSEATVEFEAAGGYDLEKKIANVLNGLGFVEDDWDRLCSEFSGGWQMRIALARLLLSEPGLLILDEPTNHLDKGAKEWLGNYLSKYDGTLLVVSHDEGLLKSAVNSIAEIKNGKMELYKSRSYDQWAIEREERVKAALAEYEANQREIARLQTFVDRFGAKTMGASLAQSKMKTIEKLENATPEAPITGDGPLPNLRLPKPPRGSQQLLEIRNGAIAWTDPKNPAKDVGGVKPTPILSDVNIVINRGMKIAVRGPNGAGKSTLFQALSGALPLQSGSRLEGDGLELGFFQQDLAQALDPNLSAVDVVLNNVRPTNPTVSNEQARTVLGSLGLMKEKAVRLVGHLSGGEKARVALASFVLISHNLLLLDEPSNHLDAVTITTLTKALKEFEGTVIVISHDRSFLEEYSPTHVMTVRNGCVVLEERELRDDDWNDILNSREASKFASNSSPATSSSKTVNNSEANNAKTSNGKKNKKEVKQVETPKIVATSPIPATTPTSKPSSKGNPRQISKIESSLAKYEAEKGLIDTEMINNGSNREKLYDLQKKKDDIQAKLDKLYAEYELLV